MSDSIGQDIINRIISSKLMHAICAHDPNHKCVVVWSSGAAEQLDALSELTSLREQVKALKAERAEWMPMYRSTYGHDWNKRTKYNGF